MTEPLRGIVLLDTADDERSFTASMLRRLGHPVVVYHGPAAKTLCPILGGEGCALFEEAHGVVFELDLDRPQHRAILARYRELARDDLPIRAVVRPDQRERYAAILEGVDVWDHTPSVSELDGFAALVEAGDR